MYSQRCSGSDINKAVGSFLEESQAFVRDGMHSSTKAHTVNSLDDCFGPEFADFCNKRVSIITQSAVTVANTAFVPRN